MGKTKTFLASYGATLFWAGLIMVLCILPGNELPNIDFWDIDIEDKLAHAGVFFILGFLLFMGRFRRKAKPITKKSLIKMMVLMAVYGAATEIIQELFIPTRFGDIMDFVADTAGGILGIVFAKWMFVKKR